MVKISADVFSHSNEAVVLLSAGRISYANRRAIRLLGQDCVGKRAVKCFSAEILNSQASCFTAELSLESGIYTACVSHCDGSRVIFIHEDSSPADYVGEKFWVSMKDGLMNLSVALELWREQACNSDNPQLKKSTAAMTRSYYKMSRVVSNISHVLNYENCRPLPCPQAFDLSLLCWGIKEQFEFYFPQMYFSLNCPPSLPLCADMGMLNAAIINLISNAVIHAEGCSQISLSVAQTDDSAIISLSDDGCGIKAEDMHTVFCRYREHTPMPGTGAGFGLSVVRSIARLCGGTLLLESRSGHGTTVRMSVSKHLSPSLHSSSPQYYHDSGAVLTGLADCLPDDAFIEKLMD